MYEKFKNGLSVLEKVSEGCLISWYQSLLNLWCFCHICTTTPMWRPCLTTSTSWQISQQVPAWWEGAPPVLPYYLSITGQRVLSQALRSHYFTWYQQLNIILIQIPENFRTQGRVVIIFTYYVTTFCRNILQWAVLKIIIQPVSTDSWSRTLQENLSAAKLTRLSYLPLFCELVCWRKQCLVQKNHKISLSKT